LTLDFKISLILIASRIAGLENSVRFAVQKSNKINR
jgi:hypothetical protein